MGKSNNKPSTGNAAPATKSRKPRFKGINHPKNLHKAFRSHGNSVVIKAVLGR